MTDSDAVTIEGTLERVRFTRQDDAWSVVTVRVAEGYPGAGSEVTAVGNLAGVQPGEHLRLTGRWRDHTRWGRQLQIGSCLPVAPSTVAGMERYLGPGLVKGIGAELAARNAAAADRRHTLLAELLRRGAGT